MPEITCVIFEEMTRIPGTNMTKGIIVFRNTQDKEAKFYGILSQAQEFAEFFNVPLIQKEHYARA